MPEPQLLADEHIPKTVVKRLNSFGIDAIHVDGRDLKGTSDEDLYELAASEGRAILRPGAPPPLDAGSRCLPRG